MSAPSITSATHASSARTAAEGYVPSKASLVCRRLRRDIVAGTLQPGRKLSFDFLTKAYAVGLSPLREALCLLTAQGLVVLESQRGFHVAPVSPGDLADVASMRRHLEVHALGLSIDLGGEDWRSSLREADARFGEVAAKVGDQRPISEDWQLTHRRYHFALIGACGSPTLLQFCEQIYDRFDRYRRLAIPVQSFMAGPAHDHHALTRATLTGARGEAQSLLARHVDDMAELVLTKFAS